MAARKSKELRKLEKIFKNIEAEKRQTVEKLIENAAFISEQLDMLMMDIRENGYVSEYQNGENQFGTKQSDEVKTLLAMQKNLTAAIKTLADIAPASKPKKSRLQDLMGRD